MRGKGVTSTLALMAVVLLAAGIDLNALLPYLPTSLVLPGVVLAGWLLVAGAGCGIMAAAAFFAFLNRWRRHG